MAFSFSRLNDNYIGNMVGWSLCGLFSNKEAVTILLWYITCFSVYYSVCYQLPSYYNPYINNIAVFVVLYISNILLYSILGLFADVFIGRYQLIQFSLWIQWITVLVSTIFAALLPEYDFHTWLQTLLYSILFVIQMLGQSSFQVVAIQFGTDQLQGVPSDHLSAFVFWYFMSEIIPKVIIQWIAYFLSFIEIKPAKIYLGWNLFTVIFVSLVLCIKNCLMSTWFSREILTSSRSRTTRNCESDSSNPYHLIYHVLKFAKEHRSPIQRSALTYWEDEIPSRIDLGKKKYGGPFTNEEVEDVRTFLQLLKLLLSLSGILVALLVANLLYIQELDYVNYSQTDLINALCSTATIGLLILFHAFCYSRKCHLSMLKRIGIGAAFAVAFLLSTLLINSIKHFIKDAQNISYVNLVIPNILFGISHFVLAISLLEFIIAQSPHTMKGILIGFYYVVRYGIAGLFALIQKLFCTYVHTTVSCSEIVSNIVITIIALLSFIMYCIVAYKYKLRERDEVVNVHIFAEEYYGNHKEDSNTDYSDVDA